jgi:hypothetical protein
VTERDDSGGMVVDGSHQRNPRQRPMSPGPLSGQTRSLRWEAWGRGKEKTPPRSPWLPSRSYQPRERGGLVAGELHRPYRSQPAALSTYSVRSLRPGQGYADALIAPSRERPFARHPAKRTGFETAASDALIVGSPEMIGGIRFVSDGQPGLFIPLCASGILAAGCSVVASIAALRAEKTWPAIVADSRSLNCWW